MWHFRFPKSPTYRQLSLFFSYSIWTGKEVLQLYYPKRADNNVTAILFRVKKNDFPKKFFFAPNGRAEGIVCKLRGNGYNAR